MSRRPHLTLLRQAVADDDYAYDPPVWLGAIVALGLGVLLFPVVYVAVLVAHYVYVALASVL